MQRTLFQKNIVDLTLLPRTTEELLKFFEDVPINPASLELLASAFNLTVPILSGKLLAGHGYDLVNDVGLPGTPFLLEKTGPSGIDFQIPAGFTVTMLNRMETLFYPLTSTDDYLKARLAHLGLQDSFPTTIFSPILKLKEGYNLLEQDAASEHLTKSGDLSAVLEYHMFQLHLDLNATIFSEFSSAIESLSPLNRSDLASFRLWDGFFKKYGTHTVQSAFGGGRIRVTVKLNETTTTTKQHQFSHLTEGMSQILQSLADSLVGKMAPILALPAGISFELVFEGGDPKFGSISEIDDWKDSVHYNPIMLGSDLNLVATSEIVSRFSTQDKVQLIEDAASTLFNASFVYIPVQRVRSGTASREHTASGWEAGIGSLESVSEYLPPFLDQWRKKVQKCRTKCWAVFKDNKPRRTRLPRWNGRSACWPSRLLEMSRILTGRLRWIDTKFRWNKNNCIIKDLRIWRRFENRRPNFRLSWNVSKPQLH